MRRWRTGRPSRRAARPGRRAVQSPDVEHLQRLQPVQPALAHAPLPRRRRPPAAHGRPARCPRPARRRAGNRPRRSLITSSFSTDLRAMARVRMVLRIAERVEHHHAVGHGRVDRAQPVLAVQPLADEGDRRVDRALAQALRETAARPTRSTCRRRGRSTNQAALLMRRLRRPGRPTAAVRRNSSSIADAARIARPRLQRHQHQQRHHHGARPVGHLVEMERKPARQQHDLDRHHRHRSPGTLAEQRQQDAGEDVGAAGAAARAGSPRARAPCAAHRRHRRSSSARNRPSRSR